MRGPKRQAIVVRKPDGQLEVKEQELSLIKDRHPILGIPIVRGSVNFIDSMVKGVAALMWSAEFYPEDETPQEPSKLERWMEEKLGGEKAAQAAVTLAVVLGLGFSVGLFFLLPTFLVSLLDPYIQSYVLRNLVSGLLRVGIFIGYLVFCSRMKDIRRVFSYHGAEHKTIFCYEKGLELTVENVRKQPRFHPRCGTSFLFVVIVVSILVFSVVFALVPPPNVLVRMLAQLALLPLTVGISYEINRYVGRRDNAFTRFMTAPGLWLQNFTTNEPDDAMIEVGIHALKLVLPQEKGGDAW
ncbi:hypothetical protein SDC9_83738 [bioreactor metagenome]|uniref:DUF1385 domain-containing protein n=1 Tax=bioreactor metagenome TaxID=1076179 RepID=A0A644Z8I6_9ZZZZ